MTILHRSFVQTKHCKVPVRQSSTTHLSNQQSVAAHLPAGVSHTHYVDNRGIITHKITRRANFISSAATIMSNRNSHQDLKTTNSSSTTVSRKRKMSTQPKFYAVRAGHNPGVYLTWAECEQNITKFKNALCMNLNNLLLPESC